MDIRCTFAPETTRDRAVGSSSGSYPPRRTQVLKHRLKIYRGIEQ